MFVSVCIYRVITLYCMYIKRRSIEAFVCINSVLWLSVLFFINKMKPLDGLLTPLFNYFYVPRRHARAAKMANTVVRHFLSYPRNH